MISLRNPGKIYPVSEDIVEIDLGTDIDEYNYDGRYVFRGNVDPEHSTDSIKVYWLYDDNSKRVGLVEHEGDDHTCLWFRSNVFSTLLQEDWEAQDKTLWSLMSQAAYEDCMKHGWTTVEKVAERTRLNIITPDMLKKCTIPVLQKCSRCMSTKQKNCLLQDVTKSHDIYSTIFVDEDGVVYSPPDDSIVYATLRRLVGFDSPAPAFASGSGAGAGAGAGAEVGAGI